MSQVYKALSFFRSVINSGEKWGLECELAYTNAINEIDQLEKDKAGLVKSLKFYAKHDNYCDEAEGQDPLIYLDIGQVARDAIKQHGGEKS